MSKCTPGVWVWEFDSGKWEAVIWAGDAYKIHVADIGPSEKSAAEVEANARLIAAAPDLLAALKLCAAVCAGETSDKNGLIRALEAARDAIRKAEAA